VLQLFFLAAALAFVVEIGARPEEWLFRGDDED
jgi:hypothetical protein